ncbi:ABC transporter permease subunit [Paenibacillus sp. LMG 31461]|uniref:ABC transporter permease subunit n=1 Tax=Paenibacillus plantarum TaxID=2654975 RepID=A0ABX1X883_9BACL|nr:ABC transporter permease subunit [Paenibacillus plantarum]NOU64647.1 ABC transporter permease subunit [Paenibacillus plantarum]
MSTAITESIRANSKSTPRRWDEWKRGIPIYLMILPGFLYFIVFKYIPMGGIIIAFQNYDPFEGFLQSQWIGFDNFIRLFKDPDFWGIFRNTLVISALNLFFFFPVPIILSLLLNEVRIRWYKKWAQTLLYVPHFLSWVVIVSMTVLLFSSQDGGINILLSTWGYERVELMTDPSYFRMLYLFQVVWKEAGWSAIIFLAALASVDPTLYEAARVDGASRWRQIWHINLPALRATIIILFILRLGHVMDSGFEHILLLQNSLNIDISEVFDTYVFRVGINQGEFSYTTAVGLFKGLVGLVLVYLANKASRKIGEEGVY